VLETTKECLLKNPSFFVSQDYIVAVSQGSSYEPVYYKFSANGKFIRKIINNGRGPQEISAMANHYFDEDKNTLYLNDLNKNYLIVYDLVSDQFKNIIKKSMSGSLLDFGIIDDSLIVSTYYNPKKLLDPYCLYLQNFQGNIISKISNSKKILVGVDKTEAFQQINLYNFNKNYFIKFIRDDTVFLLKNNKLIPYIAFNFKNTRTYPPSSILKNGDQGFSVTYIAQNFILFRIWTAENVTYYSGGNVSSDGKSDYFLFNKETGEQLKIKSYTNDYIMSKKLSSQDISFPWRLNSRRIIIVLNPFDINRIFTDTIHNNYQKFDGFKHLQNISSNIKETDNPVLLIGQIKN
jgi:hypothetical protein